MPALEVLHLSHSLAKERQPHAVAGEGPVSSATRATTRKARLAGVPPRTCGFGRQTLEALAAIGKGHVLDGYSVGGTALLLL